MRLRLCNPLPPKGGSLLLKPDSPIEGSSSLWIIELPSGIEPSGICSLPLPAKAGSPTETECGIWKLGILGCKRRTCQVENTAKAITDKAHWTMELELEEVGFICKGVILKVHQRTTM